MGIRDWFVRKPVASNDHAEPPNRAVAASDTDVTLTFNNSAITYNGSIEGFDYDSIMRDKQSNINQIYQLGDYFVDSDDLVGSAVKHVYTPFSISDGYYLNGGTDKTRAKYEEYYDRIHLNEKLESWFYQYWLFGNVYFSIQDDGDIITLPPHLVRISNVSVNGNPVVEFNAKTIRNDLKKQGVQAFKKFIEDEDEKVRLSGFPKEVTEALVTQRKDWVQLDPAKTFVWQAPKPEWQRYAMPIIVMCLRPLAKKALISRYEDNLLNLAAASFIHASVGSPSDNNVVVDLPMLTAVRDISKKAMTAGGALAVTNNWVEYKVIQPDTDKMFDNDKYASPNEEILSSLGISNSVASGSDSALSFGSSQISTKIVSLRISNARKSFCALMTRINRAVNGADYGLPRSTGDKIPEFAMPATDLSTVEAFQKSCKELWDAGVLSNTTLLKHYGLDVDIEFEQKKKEKSAGHDEVFTKPGTKNSDNSESNNNDGDNPRGRPTLDDNERASDPGNSETGRQPKPSNEEGSEAQE